MVVLLGVLLLWLMRKAGPIVLNGGMVFQIVSSIALFFWCFTGASQTADALSEEKREGTIGLLILTKLTPLEVVLGKLAVAWMRAFYTLITASPVFALVFTLGGIRPGEFWKVMLNLICTLFFGLCAGLFASSRCFDHKSAHGSAGRIMLFFMIVLPAASELLLRKGYPPDLCFVLNWLSPVYAQTMALDISAGLRQNYYWSAILKTILLGSAFLGAATWSLRRTWQEEAPASRITLINRWRNLFSECRFGNPAARLSLRRKVLEQNPFCWLASRDRLQLIPLWCLIALAPPACLLATRYPGVTKDVAVGICFMAGASLVLMTVLTIASSACVRLAEDRHTGSLEMLLATSLSVPQIIRGQWLALGRQFAWPALLVLVMNLGQIAAFYSLGLIRVNLPLLGRILGITFFIVALLAWALVWLGMWQALRAKQPKAASASAFLRVVFLPPILWILIEAMLAAIFRGRQFSNLTGLFVVILNSVFWATWGRYRLRARFRLAATDRYQPPEEPWPDLVLAFIRRRSHRWSSGANFTQKPHPGLD